MLNRDSTSMITLQHYYSLQWYDSLCLCPYDLDDSKVNFVYVVYQIKAHTGASREHNSLYDRRSYHPLLFYYKIINGLAPAYLKFT